MFNKKNQSKTENMLASYNSETVNMTEEMASKVREHKKICDFIHNLYVTKNRDYGDSMHPLYEEYGLTAFTVLFGIKLSRIKSLMTKGGAKYESLEDSLMDLANYALIAVTELRAEKNKHTIDTAEPKHSLVEGLKNSNAIKRVTPDDMYRRGDDY